MAKRYDPRVFPSVLNSFYRAGVLVALTAIALLCWSVAPVHAQYATDDASNPVDDNGWDNGDNGGEGFGAWDLNTGGGTAGHFIGTPSEIGTGGDYEALAT